MLTPFYGKYYKRQLHLAQLEQLAKPDLDRINKWEEAIKNIENEPQDSSFTEEERELFLEFAKTAQMDEKILVPLSALYNAMYLEAIPRFAKYDYENFENISKVNPAYLLERKEIYPTLRRVFIDDTDAKSVIKSIRCSGRVRDDLLETYENEDEKAFNELLRHKDCYDYSIPARYLYEAKNLLLLKEFLEEVKKIRGEELVASEIEEEEFANINYEIVRTEAEELNIPSYSHMANMLGEFRQNLNSGHYSPSDLKVFQYFSDYGFAMMVYLYDCHIYFPEEARIIQSLKDTDEYKTLYEKNQLLVERIKAEMEEESGVDEQEQPTKAEDGKSSSNSDIEEKPQIESLYISWEDFKAMEECQDVNLFLEHSVSRYHWMKEEDSKSPHSLISEYEMTVKVYNVLTAKSFIPNSSEDFKIFLFRMTGKHKTGEEPKGYRKIRLDLNSDNFYCLIKNLTRPENPSKRSAKNKVYETAYNLFDWNGKAIKYIPADATRSASDGRGWYERTLEADLGNYYKQSYK